MGTFADFQPRYAEHGIAAVPLQPIKDVKVKKPYISGAQHLQIGQSMRLVRDFPNAGVAFWAGKRNGITVLDVDSTNENDLADAMTRFGQSPFIVRTAAKGGFHAYYRHNREKHGIKPEDGKRWDILTNSLVVAPPTACVATRRNYQIIHGSLEDLDSLPVMCDAPKVPEGKRNRELWMHCMRHAPHCNDLNDLLDVATTFNLNCEPPLPDKEVESTTKYVWEKTEKGLNFIGLGRFAAVIPAEQVNELIRSKRAQDELLLTTFLRANEKPDATFIVANGLSNKFGWPRSRLAAARKRMIDRGVIRRVAAPSKGPHMFRWASGVQK